MTEAVSGDVLRALGLHHTLMTAVADLIDNSIDAGAQHVVVRFRVAGHQITALRIIDDGSGMDTATLDAAMRYGAGRSYTGRDQGHFGVGLKAASLSQANVVTVYSRASGSSGQGVRMSVERATDAPTVSRIDNAAAATEIASETPRFPFPTGTIVEWQGIRTFPVAADPDDQDAWLEATIGNLRDHLGLVFHRLIAQGLTLSIDVFDVISGRAGAPRSVRAIDPFGYRRSGSTRYPRELEVDVPGVHAIAHVWPHGVSNPEFALGGVPGREHQGFFVYRNDRLLQAGGWLGVLRSHPDFAQARVAVDIRRIGEAECDITQHAIINPEKSGVRIDATLAHSLRTALHASGYLDDVRAAARAGRAIERRPVSVIEPASGLPESVMAEFADAFTLSDDSDPVGIGWRVLSSGTFFEVDILSRQVWINARFRRALGGDRADATDLPVVRTLLFLLAEHMFTGIRLGSKQIEQLQAWQRVLIAAMRAEENADAVDD
ncbi:hypothetical protein GCM10027169_23050 [Gordonia jinhuaensis]|uniref:Histidine kinase-, DNA gyrase B-, and HSP90-like ATPase n=1 Tax=Gordonia jinhuaensis TaxID=1517702 RepID=A0A916TEZ6_9ACTN|nr:ATP-binding protein [Gordonia jinhuaensis]GGB40840.1 hypothetical protein GCM10011489_30510 [Gordonia jinhuaensis]